jgi:hypothetical protein
MAVSGDLHEALEGQNRQFIDAEVVFRAYRQAVSATAEVRGSMFWRDLRGKRTLIRSSAAGSQKSLGFHSDATQEIFDNFQARKSSSQERVRSLTAQLAIQQRLNRALRVGRVPNIVVKVLNALHDVALDSFFTVVGTHALYAYEQAAGVRISQEAMATRDVDRLFDVRKRVSFFTTMKRMDSSLISILKKADASFEIARDQLYTARNKDGFEVDIIRRNAKDADPHPLRMSDDENDFWAGQVSLGEKLQSARPFEQVVVATSGEMAVMRTVHPLDFARSKVTLSKQSNRDATKRGKDALQAQVVTYLVEHYLPHLQSL